MNDLEARVSKAVRHFWETRARQSKTQGTKTGVKDYGTRGAVTGGAQLDGFITLMHELLQESGLPNSRIFRNKRDAVLPGFFRPTKEWDLVVVVDGSLVATIEFKSQVGSFGNNFNNRTEEAVGNATDILTAYREGAFRTSPRPWLGYFFLLEEKPGSLSPVGVKEPHYPVFPEFRDSSYSKRYQIFCRKLVRERLYDAACLLLSNEKRGLQGGFAEGAEDISSRRFAASLMGHASAFARMGRKK